MLKRKILTFLLAAMLATSAMACTGEKNTGNLSVDTNMVKQESSEPTGEETGKSDEQKLVTDELSDNQKESGEITTENKEEQKVNQIEISKVLKTPGNNNPLMTQRFGADPYALVYDGRVYIYMTADEFMYNADGTVKENNYSNIWKIRVISSDDLANWTDHGEVYAASANGAAKWGGNSWAPAAAWKMIDGKPKFFLYFANSGNGIAVLTSDTPYGPFTDPIGKALISRQTPTCAEVAWLFDPAVLMDDDGSAYIYFGGGIPTPDMAANPGTARVAKLGADMISLDGDPKPIENVEYLFEDSGINKINGKYVYSYCSNFNVPAGHKFDSGEIMTMVSDNPMGPFTFNCGVLKNPGAFFGQGGNNHHCIFEFNNQLYITYHARLLENAMGNISSGYRSTNIDYVTLDENGQFLPSRGTKEGVKQVKSLDPYASVSAVTVANQAGNSFIPADEAAATYGSGDMLLSSAAGSWSGVVGADFGDEGASKFQITLKSKNGGAVHVRKDFIKGDDIATVDVSACDDFTTFTAELGEKLTGVHSIYFIFEADDEEESLVSKCWSFIK